MLLKIVLLWSLVSYSRALILDRLYPYGRYEGDLALPKSDDIASEAIHLKTPIKFFSEFYNEIYVNNNGLVSFAVPIEEYVSVQFPIEYLMIASLYSNVDTRRGGTVWYRESLDPIILQTSFEKISQLFDQSFRPKSVFIVTWDRVAHINATGEVNTFQLAISSDGKESFLEFLYPEGGIQWIRTRDNDKGLPDAKAQAGIVSHDGRLFTLPNSGTDQIQNLDKLSNAGEPGLFAFRIGTIKDGENVQEPTSYQNLEEEVTSCDRGSTNCHSKAMCVDKSEGYCCICESGYYGNGINCIKEDVALRVSGKVTMVNEGEMYLQAYLLPSEGASYTALTKVPSHLGSSIQLLEPMAATLGWLIAKPIANGGINGFQLTGGIFNSSIEARWPGGEKMIIKAKYLGLDIVDQLKVEAEVIGTLPGVQHHQSLSLQDYVQDLTATDKGQLRSQTQLNILVDNKDKSKGTFVLLKTETIQFKPSCLSHLPTSLRLKSSRHQLVFNKDENVVRFASFNKISSNLGGEDPCIEGQVTCVANSSCVVDGDSFKCICNPGFEVIQNEDEQNGCQDINECEEGSADCHSQAICVNEVGTFHCQCRPGYEGDGQNCVPEESCANDECDQPDNGYCTDMSDPESCTCNPGYASYTSRGRLECWDVNECLESDVCGGQDKAECLNTEGSYTCMCRDGFTLTAGNLCTSDPYTSPSEEDPCEEDPESCQPNNGYCNDIKDLNTCRCVTGWRPSVSNGKFSCVDRNECAEDSPCDVNAQCFNNWGSFECTCRQGYTGDGYDCTIQQELGDCREIDCGPRSHCEEDLGGPHCVCDSHYSGQHPNCIDVDTTDCYVDSDCGENGRCDQSNGYSYRCVCKEGYQGDGFQCIPERELPTDSIVRTCLHGACWCPAGYHDNGALCIKEQKGQCRDYCGANAQCLWVPQEQDYQCTCNPGYEGNGLECSEMEISCALAEICDINASCKLDEGSRGVCICNEGFGGDGITCYPTGECTTSDDCKDRMDCIYNKEKEYKECACIDGTTKDQEGNCIYPGSSEETCSECSENASCLNGICVCKPGFRGDGHSCHPDCSEVGGCSPDADCIYNTYNNSYYCVCRQDYEGDGYSCSLIQNCLNIPDLCSIYASCLRTAERTYICSCNQGYYGNGSVCKEGTKLDGEGFLLVNQGRSTLQVPLENGANRRGRPIHFHTDQVPIGIAVDCVEGRVYWSDIGRKSIQSSKYDGTDLKPVITTGLESSEGVAIDWLNRAVYWTDSERDSISKADMDNWKTTVIVSDGLVNPRGITVHPARRKIYWSDWDRDNPKLEFSDLDGNNRAVLLKGSHVKLPNSLAIDWWTDELCWADAGTSNIECLGLSSSVHRTAVKGCKYPFSLAITPEKYYWTDWVTHKLESANKDGSMSESVELLFGGDEKLFGVVAVTSTCPN